MGFITFPKKDPDEVLDYSLDFTSWLVEGASMDNTPSFEVEVEQVVPDESPVTLQVDSFSLSNSVLTIWLSGGTLGSKYTLKVTGTDDQVPERTIVRRAVLRIRKK